MRFHLSINLVFIYNNRRKSIKNAKPTSFGLSISRNSLFQIKSGPQHPHKSLQFLLLQISARSLWWDQARNSEWQWVSGSICSERSLLPDNTQGGKKPTAFITLCVPEVPGQDCKYKFSLSHWREDMNHAQCTVYLLNSERSMASDWTLTFNVFLFYVWKKSSSFFRTSPRAKQL